MARRTPASSAHATANAWASAEVPEIAPINSARAIGVGDRLGSVEVGKLADLVVVKGIPLADIRNTHNVRMVFKAGRAYDPAELFKSVEGKLGPANAAEATKW